MKKIVSASLALLLAFGLSGCIEQAALVRVEKDGSGTLALRVYVSSAMGGMMGGVVQDMIGDGGGAPSAAGQLSAEVTAAMQNLPASFGSGLIFKEGRRVVNARGWKGFQAVYAFEDINTVRLSDFEMVSSSPDETTVSAGAAPRVDFSFRFTPGETALLEIVPRLKDPGAGALRRGAGEEAESPEVQAAMMGMMAPLLEGMRMRHLVKVNGDIVETNAKFCSAKLPAVLLLDFEADKLFEDPEMAKLLSGTDPDALKKASEADIPGLKLQDPDKTIIVKFR